MHSVSIQRRRSRLAQAAIVGVGGLSALIGSLPNQASASVINVAMANQATTTSNTDTTFFGGVNNNHGFVPVNYTVPVGDIPLNGRTQDAADPDAGTKWNSLQAVSTPLASNTTGVTMILEEQNLALVDSSGASTGVTLNIYSRLPNNKGTADQFRTGIALAMGSDGLLPSPLNQSVANAALANDGWATGSNHDFLMGSQWNSNGSGEGFGFTISGLTPSHSYSLYVYAGGNTPGQGGSFQGSTTILTDGTGATAVPTLTGTAVQTNSVALNATRSVFDSSGTNAAPEQGLSWNLLTLTSDANGQLSFMEAVSSGLIKPSINGFQLDDGVSSPSPEPASTLLFGLSSAALLMKRRNPKK